MTKQLTARKITSYGVVLNAESATNAIRCSIETILARYEPISRVHDPFFHNELAQCWGSPILKYIPASLKTIFEKYIAAIDDDTFKQITELLQSVIGGSTLAVDSVTVGGTSYFLYTYSKGSHSIFLHSTCLHDQVHISEKEKEDILKKVEECVMVFKLPINALAVDNSACSTMLSVAKQYAE